MLCNKCNQPLPGDSEFCQYCGAKLEIATENGEIIKTDDTVIKSEAVDNPTPNHNPSVIVEESDADDIPADVEENDTSTTDVSYSLKGTEKDISLKYIDAVGKAIAKRDSKALAEFVNIGAISPEFYNQLIETYGVISNIDTDCHSDTPSDKADKKKRFCKLCGGLIDKESKKCTSCGKQYFKLPKPSKRMILPIVICSVLIGAIIVLSILLVDRSSTLTLQRKLIKEKNDKISSLEKKVATYKETAEKNSEKAEFMDDYIVIVGDSNKKYHKLGCKDLDTSYFYAYNVENAKAQGYRVCSKCN